MYRETDTISKDDKCIIGMEDPPSNMICSSKKKDHCYIKCEDRNFPQIVFSLFNLVPAIYIVCFLFIVFASLTFRIKRINRLAIKEKLCRSILTEEQ